MDNNKILVDSREDQKILQLLQKENIPYEVVALPVGDYAIGEVVIERKTVSDFVGSSYGHLQEQTKNMIDNNTEIKQVIIALIGDYDDLFWQRVKVNQNGFYGMLASLTMKYKVSIIHFKRETQFVNYLAKCLEKKDGVIDFTKIKKLDFKDNTELSLLCALPNISITKANKILENHTIKLVLIDKVTGKLIQGKEKMIIRFKKIDGIGKKICDKLMEYFY